MGESKERQKTIEEYERELQESKTRFQNIIGRSADGILIVDMEGSVRFANPVAGAIFGCAAEALIGEDFGFPVVAGEKVEVDLIGGAGELVTADMRVTETRWEGEPCYLVSLRDITERKRMEERTLHLNNVLRAIREVGQIVAREKDRDRLLQAVCDTIVDARGYYNAWIALLDQDGDLLDVAEAGLEEDFLPLLRRLERGEFSHCIRCAMDRSGVVVIERPFQTCVDCPLAEGYHDRGALSVRLEHRGEVYGVLTVSTPREFITNDEEQTLLKGMADDIAFALRNITLERRREQLEQIVNRSPAVAFLWRAEDGWPVEYVSDNVDQFGYKPDDFYSGRVEFADLVHPDDMARVEKEVAEAKLSGSKQFIQEYRVISASGETRWVDDRTWIRRDSDGRATHYEGIILDITERKRAQDELQRSARLNRVLLDSLPHPAMLIHQDRTVLAANRSAREFGAKVGGYCWLEFANSGFIPQEVKDCLEKGEGEIPPDVKCTFCLADEALEAGEATNIPELEAFDKLWDTWWVPINDETYLQYAIDITERQQMEQALRDSERRLDQMLQTMVDGMVMVDLDGQITYANPSAQRILEVRRDGILGRYYHEREWRQIDADGNPYPAERLPITIALEQKREVKGMEHGIEAPNGQQKWLSVNTAPLVDEEGQLYGAIASFRDVTERKDAQQKIERYAAELERSNQDLEQFAYVVSHDMREPLRMVASYLGLLKRRYRGELDEKADMFIDYAVDGAERMQGMIRAILDLSRVDTRGEEFAPTDVEAVVERTLMALGRVIRESGAEVTYDPLPTVMADKAQLTQVFQNLIANGIKFRREDEPPRVHISVSPSPQGGEGWGEGEWLFAVEDNGIGIDPEQAERIFQIFQRLHTEDEYPGLGIGLALCKRIVERHGGRIWVDSEPGKGSRFIFTMPKG